nr:MULTISPECIES: mandelate racemase/muconate lactonizing enzyme family protein [unclassified Herbaspirillum]
MPFDAGRTPIVASGARDAYNAASPELRRMETLLVKLTDEQGREGWGEAFGHLINPVTFAALAGPVGRWFSGVEFLPTMDGIAAVRDAADRALHAFGRTGPVLFALSAIDTALWDLAAQAAGEPLYRWMGGKRETIDVYASLVSYDNDPDEVARQVQRAARAGFKRLKLHETEHAAIVAAREALPKEIALAVDVNCPWQVAEAVTRVAALNGIGLEWIEEPVWPPDDLDGLAQVRRQGVPVSAGENASGVAGFRQAFASGAIDIAQPSLAKIGGFTGMREVIAMAGEYRVQVMPHCFYYGPGLLATAHVVATLPQTAALEVPWLQWPTALHVYQHAVPSMRMPDLPGLGFQPDAAVLQEFTIDRAVLV